jgi:hypothetical protein
MRILIFIILIVFSSCTTTKEVLTYAGGSGSHGYIDTTGKWIIKPSNRFSDIYQFTEGCASVCSGYFNSKELKWGYINLKGNYIIKPQFDNAFPFSEGLAAVRKNNKWGFINKEGQIVIDYTFDKVLSFINGFATVEINGFWGLINKAGNFFIDPISEETLYFINDSTLLRIKLNDKYGFIDKKGQIVIQPKYKYASDFSDGLAAVSDTNVYAFINSKGDIVLNNNYKFSWGFEEGLAAVELANGNYIHINKFGENVFNKEWDNAYNFQDGFAVVVNKEKYGVINREGEIVIQPIHSYTDYLGKGFFSFGVGADTIVNSKGKIIWTQTSR